MKHLNTKLLLLLTLNFIVFSCSSDDDSTINSLPKGDYENGIFVLNEGGFGFGNASVSFLDNNNQISNNQYQAVNGNTLGDTAQSIALDGDLIYFVVNGSNRLVVANRYTLERIVVLENVAELNNPRYMAVAGNKAFVSNWGDGSSPNDDFVSVIDLDDNTFETTISVAEGPEKVVYHNNLIYVLHKGGFNQNNKVSIINPNTNAVQEVVVGDVPNSYQIINNELYILCGGGFFFDPDNGFAQTPVTEPSVWKANGSTLDVYLDLANLANGTQNATGLNHYNGHLYFQVTASTEPSASGVYKLDVNGENPTKIINSNFYAMQMIDGLIYATDAADFASAGSLFVYDLGGNLTNTSYTTGVIPTLVVKNALN